MLQEWKDLVIKWLNCLNPEPEIQTIQDIKVVDFTGVFTSSYCSLKEEVSFPQLLNSLRDHYPLYGDILSDHENECWADDEQLYALASLLLLHTSVYQPSLTLRRNAAKYMNALEQDLIVHFLQKAMAHKKQLTNSIIFDCIPLCIPTVDESPQKDELESLSVSTPEKNKRRSQGSPLVEFLSSPIARQGRCSGNIKKQLSSLEDDLEKEQFERIALENKLLQQEGQISGLVKKYNEKSIEVDLLKEELRQVEEGQNALSADKGDQLADRRRLLKALADSEVYTKKLEDQIQHLQSSHDTLCSKIANSEEREAELSELFSASKQDCAQLKRQLELCTENNVELQQRCSQLQRDINQMQWSTVNSPRRPDFSSPIKSTSPAPETLGFIVEKKLIDRENENLELKKTLEDLDDELKNLKAAYSELEERAKQDNDKAFRVEKKLEAKVMNMQKTIDSLANEMSLCKKAKEEVTSEMSDLTVKKVEIENHLKELKSSHSALTSELKSLHDAKEALELKVATLEAKLVICTEREQELNEFSKMRLSEVDATQQEVDRLEIELKKSLKERSMMEQQVNETLKKLNYFRNIEQEKADLEVQVMNLKLLNETLEKQYQEAITNHKDLEMQYQTILQAKKSAESELKDLMKKKEDLVTSLQERLDEKNNVTAEKMMLLKEKVRWEADLQEAHQRLQKMKEQLTKEELAKRTVQGKLAEALASIDRLSSNLSISTQQESDLQLNLTELSKHVKLIENQLQAMTKENGNLKIALQESSSQLQRVTQDADVLNRKLADKTMALETLNSSMTDIIKQKANLEAKFAEEKVERVSIESQLTEAKQRLKLAQAEVSQAKEELESLQKDCEEKSTVISSLEAEKNDIEDDLCHYGSKLNERIQENLTLKNELTSLKAEIEKISFDHELLAKDKLGLENKLTCLESDLLAASNEKVSLHTQFKTMLQERDEALMHLRSLEKSLADSDHELSTLKKSYLAQQEQMFAHTSQIEDIMRDQEKMKEDFCDRNQALQDEIDEKSQQLSMLKDDIMEVQESCDNLQKEKERLKDQVQLLSITNCSLEEEIAKHIHQIETLAEEKSKISDQLTAALADRDDTLSKMEEEIAKHIHQIETLAEEKSKISDQLTAALADRDDSLSKMEALENEIQAKEMQLCQSQELRDRNENIVSEFKEKLSLLEQEMCNLDEGLKNATAEKERLSQCCDQLLSEKSIKEKELFVAQAELTHVREELQEVCASKESFSKILEQSIAVKSENERDILTAKTELTDEVRRLEKEVQESSSMRAALEKEITNHIETIGSMNSKVQAMEKDIASNVLTIQKLEEKLRDSEAEKELKTIAEVHNSTVEKCEKTEQALQELQLSNQQHKELLEKARQEKETLLGQIYELQGSIDVKEELLTDTQKCVEKLRTDRDSLRELLKVKDQIITCHKATESSLQRQSNDELEVAMKLVEVHASPFASEKMAEEMKKMQMNYEEENEKLQKALEEAQSSVKSYQQEVIELKQQLADPRGRGKIAELQQDEKIWKLDRVKNQLEFQFDSMMNQKGDVEEHLSQLREIIKDVSQICDTLFAALPNNCDAVHEVTVMKKEVETKLRSVDKKYADSLCGIISLAHEMFTLKRKQTDEALDESASRSSEPILSSEKESIMVRVSKSSEAMTSLTCDVRSAINSCKFLIERCESYLKAQTRESLKIKTAVWKDVEDVPGSLEESQTAEGKMSHSSGNMEEKNAANFTDDFKNCTGDKSVWFGGSSTVEEGYHCLKKSHDNLEKQVSGLQDQLEELQSCISEQVHNEMGSKLTKLQQRISALSQRPTQEDLDEKVRELHTQYSKKLDNMKIQMKEIVKDEVDKVQQEKLRSEKDYSKRITEFEEHVQQLSAQLWKLGEKLLQEQQDRKTAQEKLVALKESQRRYMLSNMRTQSVDRLDLLLQEVNKPTPVAQLKRRCNSQTAQSGFASSKAQSVQDETFDKVMAPSSIGLAFPEEDEDGEVFNNDYLAELKEGKCRVPNDGRLSELQYRNSLCPPHLKSSYPLETQFHDPQACKDEDIKGLDRRLSRQGKDHGTTTYKKPGPPTPSKKAGRLSLQGKEDLTPRVAALRDHESQSSQGIGMLRVGKTTPSRLRALFTSSKVANAATLPSSKKEENSTPATPTSKRLSIFKRRFGSNKENQNNASSRYSSFH